MLLGGFVSMVAGVVLVQFPDLSLPAVCGIGSMLGMSAKGCCYDNACVESFFHSLKVECIHGEHFISREIMRATVFNYIECDYNRWRRHSWCGGLSPEQFENKNLA